MSRCFALVHCRASCHLHSSFRPRLFLVERREPPSLLLFLGSRPSAAVAVAATTARGVHLLVSPHAQAHSILPLRGMIPVLLIHTAMHTTMRTAVHTAMRTASGQLSTPLALQCPLRSPLPAMPPTHQTRSGCAAGWRRALMQWTLTLNHTEHMRVGFSRPWIASAVGCETVRLSLVDNKNVILILPRGA